MFEHYWLFNAKDHHNTFFIDAPGPIADIFYLLQILVSGMLLIADMVGYNEVGEEEMSRALPLEKWLKVHQSVLQDVLGNNQRFELLCNATADHTKNALQEMISDFHEYDHEWKNSNDSCINANKVRVLKDFAVCDSGCGYCGCCKY